MSKECTISPTTLRFAGMPTKRSPLWSSWLLRAVDRQAPA